MKPRSITPREQRSLEKLNAVQREGQGRAGLGRDLFKHHNVAAVYMAAISDFLSDIVNFEQRRRALGHRHKRPHALHAHQQAFDGQLAQSTVDGHAAHAQLLEQLAFGRQLRIGEPGTGADFLHDGLFDPRVQGRRGFKRE